MYHESSHILVDEYFKITGINISESIDYIKAMRYDEKYSNLKNVTKYGGFNNQEDVAESIKLYNLDSVNFKNMFLGRYKIIKEWLRWIRRNS
ncbi:MAG: hypothetical protein EOM50_06880 [Erysipelotrichia bacterium]|nr:hypothetical protein [Erysipelotrichia bacterium]